MKRGKHTVDQRRVEVSYACCSSHEKVHVSHDILAINLPASAFLQSSAKFCHHRRVWFAPQRDCIAMMSAWRVIGQGTMISAMSHDG